MRIEIRNDSVVLDGYINAVQRDSRPIPSARGKFVEQIMPKTFQRALETTDNVDLLLNHDKNRKLGSTEEGNLDLFEDNIGLRGICTVTDPDIVEKAKNKQLRGWSFGFYSNKDRWEESEDVTRRYVEDLELIEVSIIDNTKSPAYIATSIESREGLDVLSETREIENRIITEDSSSPKKEVYVCQNCGKERDENADSDCSYGHDHTIAKEEYDRKIEEGRSLDYSIHEKELEFIKLKGGN